MNKGGGLQAKWRDNTFLFASG